MPTRSLPSALPLFLQDRGNLHPLKQRIKPGLRTSRTLDLIENSSHTLVFVVSQELLDRSLEELAPGNT